MDSEKNPFEGLTRKRLPGMHLVTALNGKAPLENTLAAHFFTMLHDKVEHSCLVAETLEAREKEVEEATTTLEAATLANVFGRIGSLQLFAEEWSYLDEKDASIFLILAGTAIEQTQRWIAEGVEEPYYYLQRNGERLNYVERSNWTLTEGDENAPHRVEARAYVQRLLKEVAEGRACQPA